MSNQEKIGDDATSRASASVCSHGGLRLSSPDGDDFLIPSRGLVVFIDETGAELMHDAKYPIFGLGACALIAGNYDPHLSEPWVQLKTTVFGAPTQLMHATDMKGMRPEQTRPLSEFFKHMPFHRVGVPPPSSPT